MPHIEGYFLKHQDMVSFTVKKRTGFQRDVLQTTQQVAAVSTARPLRLALAGPPELRLQNTLW